jgi:methionyl aminopeptidase
MVNVQGGVPATLGYQPPGYPAYPASLCTSLNDVVCHGIPDDRPLKNGDIVNVDVTVIKNGWHGDNSRMYVIGDASIAARRLCQITFEAMWKGIVKVRPGARLGDIGHAIQTFAEHPASRWCASSAATASARASTKNRRCCTTAARARWKNWCRA